MANSVANRNRKVRQEALREYLSERGKLDYILDNIDKIENIDSPLDTNELARLKTANEHRIKLLGKYLPDLKATEHTGEGGDELPTVLIKHV